MDQVTNFLDSIIAVEQSETDDMKLTSPLRRKARRSLSSGSILSREEKEPPSNDISLFWYLEDDHKKVANQMTDKLIERVLSVIIDPLLVGPQENDTRMKIHQTRPPFSINLMTLNSTKFAQRVSPVFAAIDDVTYMLCWKDPYLTVGVLLMGTLAILHPYLISVVPPFILLHSFLLPSYLKLYQPDPLLIDGKLTYQNPIPYEGDALAKFEPPKPVPQLSREFLMNFTDMQNHLVPYIRLYDAAISWGQHYFLFEDQNLSCIVFLILWIVIIVNVTIFPVLLPFIGKFIEVKLVLVVTMWALVSALHPTIRGFLLDNLYTEEARLSRLNQTDRFETKSMNFLQTDEVSPRPKLFREVEVFELHRLSPKHIWEPIGFTNDFFALNNPLRSNNVESNSEPAREVVVSLDKNDEEVEERTIALPEILRKATLDEIKPPQNWAFAEEDWRIDYEPLAWVESNYIMDLVNVDTDEKWVYDFAEGDKSPDGQTYRRRRWVRQCQRETAQQRKIRETTTPSALPTPSDRIGKTLSQLLN